jgi:site-specific recombinase XerD
MHDKPHVIGQVTQLTVRLWVKDQRDGTLPSARVGWAAEPCSDGSIGPRYAALKAFTRGFIFRELKLTKRDLLEDLPRWKNKDGPTQTLTAAEIKAVRDSFSEPGFESIRDRTIFEVHMATAFRYDTVMRIPLTSLNKVSGAVTVVTKGDKTQLGKVDPAGLTHVRTYLRFRPDTDCRDLFVQADGKPFGLDPVRWTFLKSRAETRENVHDDSAFETLLYPRVQSADR